MQTNMGRVLVLTLSAWLSIGMALSDLRLNTGKAMTQLTKTDLKALRSADDLCVHLGGRWPEGLVRAIKRKPYHSKDPFAADVEHVIEGASVGVETMRGAEALKAGAKFCAHVGFYHDQHVHASCVIHTLRVGDDIKFSFYPDAHTNQYASDARIHGDVLYLEVRRNGKRVARWELAHSFCPDNSARMCRGVPADKRECA